MKTFSQEQKDTFRRTFSRSLKEFFHPLTGFDIVAFDKSIAYSITGYPKDGISLKQAIKQNYGDNAVQLLEQLISIKGA